MCQGSEILCPARIHSLGGSDFLSNADVHLWFVEGRLERDSDEAVAGKAKRNSVTVNVGHNTVDTGELVIHALLGTIQQARGCK